MITLTKLVFTTDFKYVSQTQGLTMGLSDIRNGDFTLIKDQIFLHQFYITCIVLQFYWIGLDDHGASAIFAKLHIPQSIALAKIWGICKIVQKQLSCTSSILCARTTVLQLYL